MKINFKGVFSRYLILLILGLNLWVFYWVFRPLTIQPVYFLLDLFFSVSLSGNIISGLFGSEVVLIELIDACIAGSAYYLLLILNLSTPNIKVQRRINLIVASVIVFLAINVIRIFSLAIFYAYGFLLFDFTHQLSWYALSIIFVVGIWFFQVKYFKINEIPFISDMKSLYKKSSLK